MTLWNPLQHTPLTVGTGQTAEPFPKSIRSGLKPQSVGGVSRWHPRSLLATGR